ncbi:MAG TPA: hypothetical protein VLB75_12935 [Steroidobacteraceae bacterium]|nr:hypothetical protein [Steroidobacteraceae bacterium]
MRLLILCLLAGASMSLAAEQPADPHATAAAEAEAPAPAATEEAAVEPAPAEATASESAPEEAPIDPVEAARLEAEKEKAQDREFTKAGFKPRVVNGKKKYCESIGTSGSRIGKQTQCYSPEQVRAMLATEPSDKT